MLNNDNDVLSLFLSQIRPTSVQQVPVLHSLTSRFAVLSFSASAELFAADQLCRLCVGSRLRAGRQRIQEATADRLTQIGNR
jgi:hypothetical protein